MKRTPAETKALLNKLRAGQAARQAAQLAQIQKDNQDRINKRLAEMDKMMRDNPLDWMEK